MKKQFNFQQGLKTKFFLSFGLLIILFSTFGGWTFFSIKQIAHYSDLKSEVQYMNSTFLALRQAEKDFLTKEPSNSDFMVSGVSNYLLLHGQLLDSLSWYSDQIENEDIFDDNQFLVEISNGLHNYSKALQSISNKIRERGYLDLGMEGELRKAIHDVENDTLSYDKVLLFTLRRHEKDFLLRKESKYVDQFQQAISIFNNHINEKVLVTEDENALMGYESMLGKISNYQASFLQLVAISNDIGLNDGEGQLGVLNNEIAKITPIFGEINGLIANKKDSIRTQVYTSMIVFFIIIVAVCVVTAVYFGNSITVNIKKIKASIDKLSKGEYPEETVLNSGDEIAEMQNAINNLIIGLKDKTNFAKDIGSGKYDNPYQPLSENDVLGNALIDMREDLQKIAAEEETRNWDTKGLAKFSEILRADAHNIEMLSDNIIGNLIEYMGANQGGLFILNDDEKEEFMEITACYAWDRKKFLNMQIAPGEGLAGQCWQEKETIFIKSVPDNYMKITSGLGKSNPKCVLIVPLKVNDKVFGIIELASFNQFEDYKIEFVEKLAESIASTLSSVKINAKTKLLLQQSQQQTEEMRAQEEEMRQNQEELTATQEEMIRQKSELEAEVLELKNRLGATDNKNDEPQLKEDGTKITFSEEQQIAKDK